MFFFFLLYFQHLPVIMEKLLRTCDPDIIYILIRSKKGKDGDSRIKEIIDDPVSILNIIFPEL